MPTAEAVKASRNYTATMSVKAPVELTAEDLARLGASDGYTWMARECVLANSLVDRDYERFSPELLADFARTLPGKSLLVGHARDGVGEGVWTRAWTALGEGDSTDLRAVFAVPVLEDEANKALRARIDAGVARFVSIGFRAPNGMTCDECGAPMMGPTACRHWPGQKLDDGRFVTFSWGGPGEALEGSLVYLGSQRGAEVKSADDDTPEDWACIGRHRVKHFCDGGLALDWPSLAEAAVRIAGIRGDDGLDDDSRKAAWLQVQQSYHIANKQAPTWEPGQKFAWEQFRNDERETWYERELSDECVRMAQALVGRIKGATAQLAERDGPLPAALLEALAALDELVGPLPGGESVDGAKVGQVLRSEFKERIRRMRDMASEMADMMGEMLTVAGDTPMDEPAESPKSAPPEDAEEDTHGSLLAGLDVYRVPAPSALAGLARSAKTKPPAGALAGLLAGRG